MKVFNNILMDSWNITTGNIVPAGGYKTNITFQC